MTLKTLLLAFLVFAFTSVGVAGEKWVVPQSLCSDFSRSAVIVCTDTFTYDLGEYANDPRARKNIDGVCLTTGAFAEGICKAGRVKLDRTSVETFCRDISINYAALTKMGCEKAVQESASANPPEMNEEMLRTCREVAKDLLDRNFPACVKSFSEKPLPPERPEPKAQPKVKPGPPPFKTREESLSV